MNSTPNIAVEQVATAVIERLVDEDQLEQARSEVGRIARGEPGSGHLPATEMIVIAGLAVQVATVTVSIAQLVSNFKSRSREEKITDVLEKIAEQASDPSIMEDKKVIQVAEQTVDIIVPLLTSSSGKDQA